MKANSETIFLNAFEKSALKNPTGSLICFEKIFQNSKFSLTFYSNPILDIDIFSNKNAGERGVTPPPTSFFTKRGAQMHYIRKSYPRAFQNIQNYQNPINNDEERAKLKKFVFFSTEIRCFSGDLRSGNDVCNFVNYPM